MNIKQLLSITVITAAGLGTTACGGDHPLAQADFDNNMTQLTQAARYGASLPNGVESEDLRADYVECFNDEAPDMSDDAVDTMISLYAAVAQGNPMTIRRATNSLAKFSGTKDAAAIEQLGSVKEVCLRKALENATS